MLDFDNSDLDNIFTIEDLEQDTFLLDNACFIYRTFGDKDSKVDKFRVVFALNRKVYTNKEVELLYQKLFEKYPQSDFSVGQTSRMFFGSNESYEQIDFSNRLDVDSLLNSETIFPESTNSFGEIIDSNTPNYLLLKYGREDLVRYKLGSNFSNVFPDEFSAQKYFKTLNIREILELPDRNPFLDILHDEDSPSASVYFSEEHGIYFYKCFSKTKPFIGNILSLLSRFLNISQSEVNQVLVYITQSEIRQTSELYRQKFNASVFTEQLISGELEETHANLYRLLKRYSIEIKLTLEFMYNHVYEDPDGNTKFLNFYSIENLARMLSSNLNYTVSIRKMRNILNLIVVTEIVKKLPEEDIPEEIMNNVINIQKKNKLRLRRSNVYAPTLLDDDALDTSLDIATILLANKINISSISFELIYRLFGEEKAYKDFGQSYEPLRDKIPMSQTDLNLTKISTSLEKLFIREIMEHIQSKGYIFEKDLIAICARKRNMRQNNVKSYFDKSRAEIMANYDLERRRLTKELYERLNVACEYSPRNIIYKK